MATCLTTLLLKEHRGGASSFHPKSETLLFWALRLPSCAFGAELSLLRPMVAGCEREKARTLGQSRLTILTSSAAAAANTCPCSYIPYRISHAPQGHV